DESNSTRIFVHPSMGCNLTLARKIGYKPDFRAGEDATIIWSLSRRHNGKWIEDTLMGYVEDREINLPKAIESNLAQFKIARRLYREGILDIGLASFARMCLWWSFKIGVLQAMRLYPPLFMKTVDRRRTGGVDQSWQPDREKLEFLADLQKREKAVDWAISPMVQP
ncbi:MAG: hypothetical protein V3T31_08965, partial [candidate division Zixibacteria bacterium]